MARVSRDSLDKLNAFIDSLPVEARNKCALCNETLTHLVKTAEVETGAGTATVTRAIADRINQDASPGDRVSPVALDRRVRRQEKTILPKRENNQKPEIGEGAGKDDGKQQQCTEAYQFETIAISQLSRIRKDDPDRVGALNRVKEWIEHQLKG